MWDNRWSYKAIAFAFNVNVQVKIDLVFLSELGPFTPITAYLLRSFDTHCDEACPVANRRKEFCNST